MPNLKNKIIKKFKENIFWLFLIELFCIFFSFLIGFFGYNEIKSRMELVSALGPGLNALAGRLQGQDLSASDLLEISNQLSNVEVNVQALKLLIILIPLGIFLVYSFFQSVSWNLISKNKFNFKKLLEKNYLLTFFGVSLIYFFVMYLFFHFLFQILSLNTFLPIIALITLILFYFLFVSYGIMHKYKIIYLAIRKGITLGFINIGKLLPIMLGFLVISFILISLSTLVPNIMVCIILGILLILIWILFKIVLTEKLKELI